MDKPNIIFTPHTMGTDELIRNLGAVMCRPQFYGAGEYLVCLLGNALRTIEEMTP